MNTSRSESRPNILWIGLDQFRSDSLGAHGNKICPTPHMDRLVDRGVDFTRAYTPCSLCSPARASMMTGLYAFRHGMGTNCDMYHSLASEFPDPKQFLDRGFREAGYQTHWQGKWHIGTDTGPGDYGWEGLSLPGYGNVRSSREFQSYLKQNNLSYDPIPEQWLNPDRQTLVAGRWGGPQESTPSHFLANNCIDTMDRAKSDNQPFFVNCQFWGPHGPFMPSDDFYGMHSPEDIDPWPSWNQDLGSKPRRLARERDDFYRDRPRTWKEQSTLVARYYDMCAMIDFEIGRMMSWLDQSGLRENTIVVLSADHGDMNGSHGGLHDKGFLYDDVLKIPLVISWPSRFSHGSREDLASNMDIMPTLMDLCDIPIPENLDGRSLLPALTDRTDRVPRQEFLTEFHGLRFLYSQRALITDDGWKYIFTPGDDDEIYNLESDPEELVDLSRAAKSDTPISELQDRLEAAVHSHRDPLRDCVSKFFGHWYTGSGQLDATKFFDDESSSGSL
jgi:arylsulfatase A-like enzyme